MARPQLCHILACCRHDPSWDWMGHHNKFKLSGAQSATSHKHTPAVHQAFKSRRCSVECRLLQPRAAPPPLSIKLSRSWHSSWCIKTATATAANDRYRLKQVTPTRRKVQEGRHNSSGIADINNKASKEAKERSHPLVPDCGSFFSQRPAAAAAEDTDLQQVTTGQQHIYHT
jgi:hypothetical protein